MARRETARLWRSGEQLTLALRAQWGGRREGAGRKPSKERRNVPHRSRPRHRSYHPVHVTLRTKLRSLRSQFVFPTVRGAIHDTNRRFQRQFGIVEFSVQTNHIHLLVEATDAVALQKGAKSLSIRLAKRLNRLLFRRGKVVADRWHQHALTSPRAVRNALAYLFSNFRKHGESLPSLLDPCSSAPHFAAFAECQGRMPLSIGPPFTPRTIAPKPPTVAARSWLLSKGWRRQRPLSICEGPNPPHRVGGIPRMRSPSAADDARPSDGGRPRV